MNTQPDNDEDGTNDFMAGFNADDEVVGATGTGTAAGGGTGTGEAAAGAGTGTGTGSDAGAAGAGAGDGGAGAGTEGEQFAAGAADGGEGADGAAAGAASGNAQGVDTQQNGEQGRATSGDIDYSGLPENIRQRLEEADRLRQENEQLNGSLAETRRNYNAQLGRTRSLEGQLAATRAQQPPPASPGDQSQNGGTTVAEAEQAIAEAEAYFNSDEFKRFEETWPAEAAVQKSTQLRTLKAVRTLAVQTAAQVGGVRRQIETEIAPRLSEVRSVQESAERTQELDALTQRHPDWREINQSDDFANWFAEEEQLLNFRDDTHKAQRLNDGAYVAALLDRYKRDRGATGSQQQTQRQEPPAAGGNTGGGEQHQQVNARLAMAGGPDRSSSQTVPRPGAGLTDGDDFMAGFNS